MYTHEFFVSLFVEDNLVHELFVTVRTERPHDVRRETMAVKEAVLKTTYGELPNYTMALTQNIEGKSLVNQYRYDKLSGEWHFVHYLFGNEYMALVS